MQGPWSEWGWSQCSRTGPSIVFWSYRNPAERIWRIEGTHFEMKIWGDAASCSRGLLPRSGTYEHVHVDAIEFANFGNLKMPRDWKPTDEPAATAFTFARQLSTNYHSFPLQLISVQHKHPSTMSDIVRCIWSHYLWIFWTVLASSNLAISQFAAKPIAKSRFLAEEKIGQNTRDSV